MKSLFIKLCVVNLFVLAGMIRLEAQSALRPEAIAKIQTAYEAKKKAALGTFGTNGYRAGLLYVGEPVVEVLVGRDLNVIGTNRPPLSGWWDVEFLTGTNGFCGPFQLVNSNNVVVPTLRPELNLTNAYPEQFNLEKMRREHSPHTLHLPFETREIFLFPDHLVEDARFSDIFLGEFYPLNDLDKGEYKLTVWPKIYRRSPTNDIIFLRVDLQPVSTIIHVR